MEVMMSVDIGGSKIIICLYDKKDLEIATFYT